MLPGESQPVERIWIAVTPIALPWESASAIEFGAWNECPTSEEHVVVMRYWFERWGAEPVAITSDTVEMLSGNLIGEFAEASDAFELVSEILQDEGLSGVKPLTLLVEDDQGRTKRVANGEQLASLAQRPLAAH